MQAIKAYGGVEMLISPFLTWPCIFWYRSRYSVLLRAGRSGDQIPVGAKFSAPVQTGPGAYPASCTMGTGSFPGVKRPGRGVDHPPSSSAKVKERVQLYTSTSLWAFMACSRVTFTYYVDKVQTPGTANNNTNNNQRTLRTNHHISYLTEHKT
jgi:hypothetical protein